MPGSSVISALCCRNTGQGFASEYDMFHPFGVDKISSTCELNALGIPYQADHLIGTFILCRGTLSTVSNG